MTTVTGSPTTPDPARATLLDLLDHLRETPDGDRLSDVYSETLEALYAECGGPELYLTLVRLYEL